MPEPRVVITGVGVITAFGLGMDPLWNALCEGRSAIKRISRFDPSGFPCQVAAELDDDLFSVRKVVPKSHRKATKVMSRDIELAVGAALAGVEDARLRTRGTHPDDEPTINPDRFGCHIGAGLIAADVEELTSALHASGPDGEFDPVDWGRNGMQYLTPLWLLKYLPNMLSCHVTIIHDCRGPSNTITCAEASSVLSLGESLRVIERGQADACLTGGAEFKLNPMGFLRQHFAGRLATIDGADPSDVVRPFDRSASGSVLGEGGGILVLERSDVAEARGATPYCEVAGFASTQSFCSDTVGVDLDVEDEGITLAIQGALDKAGISPQQIDAIVPLGCGIPNTDQAEAFAIRGVFGQRTGEVPIVTVIPSIGNCCAGAGALSIAVAARMLREQRLPARISTTDPIDGLDASPTSTRAANLQHILVFTTSMGGQNAAVVLRGIGT